MNNKITETGYNSSFFVTKLQSVQLRLPVALPPWPVLAEHEAEMVNAR